MKDIIIKIIARSNFGQGCSKTLFAHPFHLVSRSPWPTVERIALGVLALRSAAAFGSLFNKMPTCGVLVVLLISL
jgi:hypothetical protein